MRLVGLLALAAALGAAEDLSPQLLSIRRIHVAPLTGGAAADQMRDLIIAALHSSKIYVLTENPEKADAKLQGAAEDYIFTDQYSSSEGVSARAAVSGPTGNSGKRTSADRRYAALSIGENESSSIRERKHESMATVRLVNKEGDVIWSTTQESAGAKFRGANVDVADKIAKRLAEDFARAKEQAK